METLRKGVVKFQRSVYPQRKAFFKEMAKGQTPEALFITCSDSRVDPALITSTGPGRLFVDRNPGNFIPYFLGENASEAAGIQYAVEALHIRNIIVCGHTDCGAMKAVLDPKAAKELSCVKKWLVNGDEARQLTLDKKLPKDEQLREVTERNVVVQLNHLKTYPAVAKHLKLNDLKLAGWIYDIGRGKVFEYNEATDKFEPLR